MKHWLEWVKGNKMPNGKNNSKTNNVVGSQKDIPLKKLSFTELWDAYPSDALLHINAKTGENIFNDSCAINVSAALYLCGIRLRSYRGTKCWACPTPDENGKGIHAIRAQELADYLKTRPFADCPKPIELTGESYEEKVSGKTGIIFFQDYWLRDGERTRSGDHIDLWNENKLASLGWLYTWTRRTFPQLSEDLLSMSDLRKSKVVIFWEIK